MRDIMTMSQESMSIALAGQPNTGKSTVFNGLTGARQHVGNWPGKTVEQKSGTYVYLDQEFEVMDLPGTYSLTANSPEEVIARDYMVSGEADAIIVMIDGSQLERSLYFLSEIAGLEIPTIIALNMMDVAREKGINIDIEALEKSLGVPVIRMVASKQIGLDTLKEALIQASFHRPYIKADNLLEIYKEYELNAYENELDFIIQRMEKVSYGNYSKEWLTIKFIERDRLVMDEVKKQSSKEIYQAMVDTLEKIPYDKMTYVSYRFKWINRFVDRSVIYDAKDGVEIKRSWIDKISTHRIWGQPMAILMILLGFALSMVICMPVMIGFMSIALPSLSLGSITALNELGAPSWLVSMVGEAIIPAMIMAIFMVFFVMAVIFVFGVMEDVGYLARVAFVFDRSMCKLGLHGKAIIPFMMSLGCNIAGVTGSRVIDSLKQRRLAIVVSLVVPCMGMWGVISFVSAIFFGVYTPLVILGLFGLTVIHMKVTSIIFGRKVIGIEEAPHGLVMELPPFHKPNWKSIMRNVWFNIKNVAQKAFLLIIGISMLMWILSFSKTGNVEDSIIYSFGQLVEPVSKLFGFDWRLFTAFIVSAMGKEAALGVLAMLFGQGQGIMSFTGAMVGGALTYNELGFQAAFQSGVSVASALAFIVAFYFNIPCMAAISSVGIEAHSKGFVAKIVGYYMATALIMGGIVYRIALLFT